MKIKRPLTTALAAISAVSALAAALVAPAAASAGEGHWSIGHGIQCHLVNGKVVCSASRP